MVLKKYKSITVFICQGIHRHLVGKKGIPLAGQDLKEKRVAVIGLDGASLKHIIRWAKDGHLPTLARLMKDGATGHLRSVIPPITPPAWTSAITGKNPGNHGVLHFLDTDLRNGIRLTSSLDRKAEPLWLILESHGIRSIVCSVPFTYPPDRFDGIMMSWTPLIEKRFSSPGSKGYFSPFQPPSLEMELKKRFGDKISHLHYRKILGERRPMEKWKEGLKILEDAVDGFSELIEHLLTRNKWNFFMFVDSTTDYLGHKAMPLPDHVNWKENEEYLRRAYSSSDRLLGNILGTIEDLGGDTTIIIMSDHGMTYCKGTVFLNRWLHRKGFLEYTVTRDSLKYVVRNTLLSHNMLSRFEAPLVQLVDRLPDHLPHPLKEIIRWETKWTSVAFDKHLAPDLERSSAISFPYYQVDILCEDCPKWKRDEIEAALRRSLMDLRNEQTGRPFFKGIVSRERFFHGPYTSKAPDLVLIPSDEHWYFSQRMNNGPVVKPFCGKMKGNHALDGLIMINGPGVRKGIELMRANIIDLAPTVMYALGLPYPQDMDGKVLTMAYEPAHLASHPVECETVSKKRTAKSGRMRREAYTEEEKKGIEEMMEALGYM